MSYKFGMPTLIKKKTILDNIILCNELELDFIELNMNLPYCMPHNNNPEKMLKLMEEYNVDFTIHFPEEIDFGCFYDEIRQANILLFNNIATWASRFGVKKINIHLNPGIYFTLPKEKIFVYDRHRELFIEKFIDSMIKIIDIAKPLGIKVCVENMKSHEFMEETFRRMVNVEGLHFTWDVGHDAMSNYKMKEIYLKSPHKVSHMHLHDYNGNSDHQILFEGSIPIKERIKFAEENNLTVVVETKTEEALRKSIERLQMV